MNKYKKRLVSEIISYNSLGTSVFDKPEFP